VPGGASPGVLVAYSAVISVIAARTAPTSTIDFWVVYGLPDRFRTA